MEYVQSFPIGSRVVIQNEFDERILWGPGMEQLCGRIGEIVEYDDIDNTYLVCLEIDGEQDKECWWFYDDNLSLVDDDDLPDIDLSGIID